MRAAAWRAWMPVTTDSVDGQLWVGLDDVDRSLGNREVLEVRYPVGLEPPCQ